MSGCTEFEALLEGLMAEGTAGAADLNRLRDHAAGCPACGGLYGLHSWLAREAPGLEEPSPEEFAAMRHGVLDRIRTERGHAAATPWWRRLAFREVAGLPRLRPAALAAAVVLLVAAGWLAGRIPGAPGAESAAPGLPGAATTLADLASDPYVVSNVSVQGESEADVSLSFDVTRRVSLRRERSDPLVRQLLIQSLGGSSDLGQRLKAVSVAGELMDPAIRETLLQVMASDPSVAVRLRAQEILGRYPSDPDVQQAMLRILEEEESVAMRLHAIDYLGSAQVQPERILTAIEGAEDGGSRAVLVRAGERLGL